MENHTLIEVMEEAIEKQVIDLSTCEAGDILISSHGATLKYVSKTPYKHCTYLDHVITFIDDLKGTVYHKDNLGTRTNDGFTFANNRIPATDHDIVKIIPKGEYVKPNSIKKKKK